MKRVRKTEEVIKKRVRKKNKPEAVIKEKVTKDTWDSRTVFKEQIEVRKVKVEKGEKVEENANNIKNKKRVRSKLSNRNIKKNPNQEVE